MYGGRQFATYDQGWVGWFCQKAIETSKDALKKEFTISGNGKQVRDVLHADDMRSLYLAALKSIDKSRGQAFNIGGGVENSLSLIELFELLNKQLKINLVYDKLPVRESDQRVFIADTAKANEILKWRPQVSAMEGVGLMLQWITSTYER
jgi:CDP-paratose 2-epimerase